MRPHAVLTLLATVVSMAVDINAAAIRPIRLSPSFHSSRELERNGLYGRQTLGDPDIISSTSVSSSSSTSSAVKTTTTSSSVVSSTAPATTPTPVSTSSTSESSTSTSFSETSSSLSVSSTSVSSTSSSSSSSSRSTTSVSSSSSSTSSSRSSLSSAAPSTTIAPQTLTAVAQTITDTVSSDIGPVETSPVANPATSSSTASGATSKGFWGNTGAVAGVFTVVGIIVVVLAATVFILRKKTRNRRLGTDFFETFNESARASPESHTPTISDMNHQRPMSVAANRDVVYDYNSAAANLGYGATSYAPAGTAYGAAVAHQAQQNPYQYQYQYQDPVDPFASAQDPGYGYQQSHQRPPRNITPEYNGRRQSDSPSFDSFYRAR